MNITLQLKQWCVERKSMAVDASDEVVRKTVADALADGSMSGEEFVKLTTEPVAAQANQFKSALDEILAQVKSQGDRLAKIEAQPTEKAVPTQMEKLFSKVESAPSATPNVRHMKAIDQYDGTRRELRFPSHDAKGRKHVFGGQRVFEGGAAGGQRFIDQPSQRDLAVCGAYLKWQIWSQCGDRGVPYQLRMTDHDWELVKHALAEMEWGGCIHGEGSEGEGAVGVKGAKLTPWQQKAVLDDSTSGGLELAPIVFDEAIITTPLLYGELFPLVDVVNITRGRRVEGATIGTVTLSSSTEGTAISLYSTASFVSAFDTTIFVCAGAIEVGLDFLSDSPVDVASILTGQYGQRLLQWLDEQIAIGDGTTEPEGITVASGTVSVSATNGNTGPPTVGDYESLLFGPDKQYKQGTSNDRIVYGANETTYQRARAIYVSSSDARRVFGMDHESYSLFGHPYKIQGNIANTKAFFGVMSYYRMYRRLGLTVKVTTEGRDLVRANEMMISARARFGGQITNGNAFAVSSNMQS